MNQTIKCSVCGLTNRATGAQCKRCNNGLRSQSVLSSTSSTKDRPRKIPIALYPLFFLMYVVGIALSGAVVFLLFYIGNTLKITSLTFAIVAGVLGFIIPLATVHYLIEAWKTRITGKPYEVSGDAEIFEALESHTAGIPVSMKIIQAFSVLAVTGVSAAVSGQLFKTYLLSESRKSRYKSSLSDSEKRALIFKIGGFDDFLPEKFF